jgi:hypothetical protein
MATAQDFIFANKAEASAILQKNSKGMSDADAGKMYDRLVAPGSGGLMPHAAMDIKGVETVLKIRDEYGEPQKKMGPPTKYVDTSFYEKAMKK